MKEFTVTKYIVNRGIDKSVYIIPFGDVHRESPNCAISKWKEFLQYTRSLPDAYFIGMGDYLDAISGSERKIFRSQEYHESTVNTIEDMMKNAVMKFAKEIEFMKGKCIGLIEGNHFFRFEDGTTSTQRLCQYLDCKYLGATAFIRFGIEKTEGHALCTDIFAHHGKGAARLTGSSFNTVEQMQSIADANIYLQGHDHKLGSIADVRLTLAEGKGSITIKDKHIFYCRTGSYLEAYRDNVSNYVSQRLLKPAILGSLQIKLKVKIKNHARYLDINISQIP